jgi:putative membrane protein
MDLSGLPKLNAVLNAISLVLLVAGYVAIRRRRVATHKALMLSAFGVSVVFLASYLTYRFAVGDKRFGGTGLIRFVYFFIVLIPHVLLAATVPFLAVRLIYLALKGRFDAHRRLARVALPIWIYVSVTGVLIYFMLFVWYPPRA